jgi:hypothetical protein
VTPERRAEQQLYEANERVWIATIARLTAEVQQQQSLREYERMGGSGGGVEPPPGSPEFDAALDLTGEEREP